MIKLDEETLKPLKRSQKRRNIQSKGGKVPRAKEYDPIHIIIAIIIAALIAYFLLSKEG